MQSPSNPRRAARGVGVTLLFAPLAAMGAEGNPYLSLSAGYRTGDFGTAVTSNLYDITPELGYVTSKYEVGVALPLLILNSEGDGSTTTEVGIGDMVARGGATVWVSPDARTRLNLGAAVKFATGDDNKGLGTGATNYGGFVSVNHEVSGTTVSVMTGYIITGSPQGVSYDDVVPYGIGLQRAFNRTNVYTSLQGQTSAVPGLQDPLEWDLGFFHILNADYVIKADGFIGLSDGSPAFGISAGFVRWF
jgi:hypothetical protein